jgi:hypothetical protein
MTMPGMDLANSYFCTFMSALALQKRTTCEEFGVQPEEFARSIPGIVIGHELSEMDIYTSGNVPLIDTDVEVLSEKKSRAFITKNGISNEHFKLYHTLRATPERLSISHLVLESIANPSF